MQQTLDAWKSILRPNWNASDSFPAADLAVVLGATLPNGTSSPLLIQMIEKNTPQLRDCFVARARGESFQFSSGAILCVSSREPFQGFVKVDGSLGVEYVTGSPHLRLGVRAEDTAHYLFLPAVLR